MKLSEAIMEGIKLRPRQAFNAFYSNDGGSCVAGAVQDATRVDFISFHNHWRVAKKETICPKCSHKDCVNGMMVHLNDTHRATREWIAMWIAELEGRIEAGVE